MSDDLLPCPFCGTTPNQPKDGVYISGPRLARRAFEESNPEMVGRHG